MNPVTLERLAKIRKQDKELYRVDGLTLRQDIHFLLEHLDVVLTLAASRIDNEKAQ